ncbi:MAG TPA: amidohydrolase family protein [Acidimicrobiia bacterium]|nr:amidohydrolase family protein [Acidimicrobiia bacterium]
MPRMGLMLVATVLVLVTAACTSGSEGGGTTTSTTAPPPPGTSTTGAEATTTSKEAAQGTADLVFANAHVITMSDAAPRAEAVAITDGVVSAVGDRETVEALIGDETQVIDLDGATVIPGLVDAHSHFFGEGITQGIGAAIQDAEILSNGITTTAEFHTTPEILEAVRGLEQAGELRVRTSLYLIYTDACGTVQENWWREHPPTREPGEMLRIGGIKVFADGGGCNVPAVSYTYEDGSTGDLYFDVDGMESIISEVEEAGYQVAVHALGDRAVATVLDAMESVIGDSGNPFRHRIDHNAVVSPDMYGRHQESGAVAVLFGAFRTCAVTDANNDYRFRTPDEYVLGVAVAPAPRLQPGDRVRLACGLCGTAGVAGGQPRRVRDASGGRLSANPGDGGGVDHRRRSSAIDDDGLCLCPRPGRGGGIPGNGQVRRSRRAESGPDRNRPVAAGIDRGGDDHGRWPGRVLP